MSLLRPEMLQRSSKWAFILIAIYVNLQIETERAFTGDTGDT